jgi:uncharacterized MAPEG superfamily protein
MPLAEAVSLLLVGVRAVLTTCSGLVTCIVLYLSKRLLYILCTVVLYLQLFAGKRSFVYVMNSHIIFTIVCC